MGTIPYKHTDHAFFELQCSACNTVLNVPAAAIAHFRSHLLPPRRFCTSPPPLQTARLQQSSSPSTVPETQDAQPSHTPSVSEAAATPSPLARFLAMTSPSNITPGQRPAVPTCSTACEIAELKQQLSVVTRHLVGLATATSRLPTLDPEKSLRDTIAAVTAVFDSIPSATESDYRQMLARDFPNSLPNVHEMPAPVIASTLLPLYELWFAENRQ